MIRLVVHGKPVTQGSKRAFVAPNGRPVMVENGGARLKTWRGAIADAAGDQLPAGGLITDPVRIVIGFGIVRPKKPVHRLPTGRNHGDVDKLSRAVLDALTGTLLGDDGQVVDLWAAKDYSDPPGAVIDIYTDDDIEWALAPAPVTPEEAR